MTKPTPVYDCINAFGQRMQIENLGWPRAIVIGQRAFDQLINELRENAHKRCMLADKIPAHYYNSVELAFSFGAVTVMP